MRIRDERGFTVVEAVIVLFMIGALGAATMSLLMSQDRFYSRVDDSVIAEQSLRAAAELASSEIRMSVPDDIFVAVPESVTFAFDVYQAVVCEVLGGNQVAMFIYDTIPNPNVTGRVGMAYKNPYVTTYRVAKGWSGGTPSLGGTAQTVCTNNLAPAGLPSRRYQAVSGWTSVFPGPPDRGAIVRKFRELSYRFGPSSLGAGHALFRGPQELAGPFDPASTFSYVMDDGTVQTSVAAVDLDRIRRVRINAIAIDDDPRFDIQRDFNLDVPLRY